MAPSEGAALWVKHCVCAVPSVKRKQFMRQKIFNEEKAIYLYLLKFTNPSIASGMNKHLKGYMSLSDWITSYRDRYSLIYRYLYCGE